MQTLIHWLSSSEHFFQSLGWLGVLAFSVSMAVVAIASAPLSIFAVSAGIFFGLSRGVIAVEIGTVLSAALNFYISRHVARGPLERKIGANPKFRAIDSAVGREGWKIVALIRLVPMPFGFVNYAFGLTSVRFLPYLAATALAIIPGNIFFVWIGATAQAGLHAAIGAGRPRHPMENVFLVVGLIAVFVALTYITRIARAAINRRAESLATD
jgi:uncharacterized membrane protein YdjX (TVP38/TMEM64 family)